MKADLLEDVAHPTRQLSHEYLAFRIGAEEYGLDILQVQELRSYEAVTAIANGSPCLKGVINLRGTIVPIIDLRLKLGIAAPTYDAFTVVVILNLPGGCVGAVVDSVSDVSAINDDQVKPAPVMGSSVNYMRGVGTVGDRMLVLVDINNLLQADHAADIALLAA